MSQKLLVNNFKWIEDTSQFNKDFIKDPNEKIYEGYFLENNSETVTNEHNKETPNESYTFPEERQKSIDDLKLT